MEDMENNVECREQNVLEYLGTNSPRCININCGERNWRCLGRWPQSHSPNSCDFVIECRKCQYIRKGKIKQAKKSKRSFVNYHACTGCGDDNCYLEDNHLYCFGGKEICVPLCINCHAIVTEDQRSHGRFPKQAATEYQAFGLLVLNLLSLLRLMFERQRDFTIIADLVAMLVKECSVLAYRVVQQEIVKAGKLEQS